MMMAGPSFLCLGTATFGMDPDEAAAQEMQVPGFYANQPLACLGARHRKPFDIPALVKLDDEAEAFHAAMQLPLFPYTSQAGGYFHKVRHLGAHHPALLQHPFHGPENLTIANALAALSDETGHSVCALTLAWWHTKPYPVHPLIGCRTQAQLEDSLRVSDVPPAVIKRLVNLDVRAEAGFQIQTP